MGVYNNLNILKDAYLTKLVNEIDINEKDFIGLSLCPMEKSDQDTIKIECMESSFGMTPPVALDAGSPTAPAPGMNQRTFQPAFFREMQLLTETDFRMREPGTIATPYRKQLVANAMAFLKRRNYTRINWLIWQMIQGSITIAENNVNLSINYDIAFNKTSVISWATIATADPINDIMTWLLDMDVAPDTIYFGSEVMRYLTLNAKVRALMQYQTGLQKNQVTAKDLADLVGNNLAGMKMVECKQKYNIRTSVTSSAASGQAVVTVLDSTGLVTADTVVLQYFNTSTGRVTRESRIISTVDSETQITLTVVLTNTFPKDSRVNAAKPFIPKNKIVIVGKSPDGKSLGNFITTPSAIGGSLTNPKSGPFAKSVDNSDKVPPTIELHAGIYGLPLLNRRDTHIVADITNTD